MSDIDLDRLPGRLLLDGGMGTALIGRGLDLSRESTAVWNLTRPDEVAAVHAEHREAGAAALHTNTFAASRIALAARGVDDVRGCNLAAAALARAAADGAFVFGDIGPTGAVPPPEGEADLFELEEVFAEQAGALAEGGVDLLHVETMYHPKEVRAALRGCRAGAPELPVALSIACRRRGDEYRSTMNFCAEQLVAVALEEKADAIGLNCSLSPADMLGFVRRLVGRGVPVFAQPSAAPEGVAPLYPPEFAQGLVALFDAGVRAAGGCCGSGAVDIAATRELLDRRAHDVTRRGR